MLAKFVAPEDPPDIHSVAAFCPTVVVKLSTVSGFSFRNISSI